MVQSKLTGRVCRFGLGMLLLPLATVVAKADSATTFPPVTSPAPGSTVDGCVDCLFDYTNTPTASTGQAVVSWSFYAANTKPVTPVIFNAAGVVVGVGTTVTPSATGLQTFDFGRTQGTAVVAAGDSVGFFYGSTGGSIAVNLTSGPGVISEAGFGGLRAGTTQIDTSSVLNNRTYYVSYTTQQVTLGPAQAPGSGAISDLCTNCLYQYAAVTSQYNGASLFSWDFYALNDNSVYPVIFDANGLVIGYGALDTPTGTGYQSFSYVPLWGTNILATGDYLGWYFPGQGSIAFTLTGGQGGTYAPFPTLSLGPGDVTDTPVTNRNYAVGFDTIPSTVTPEPRYTGIVGLCLGLLMLLPRRVRRAEP